VIDVEFIKGLLNTIGTHVDPLVLINRIDEKIQIPGLRDSLVKILHDYNLQVSAHSGHLMALCIQFTFITDILHPNLG